MLSSQFFQAHFHTFGHTLPSAWTARLTRFQPSDFTLKQVPLTYSSVTPGPAG